MPIVLSNDDVRQLYAEASERNNANAVKTSETLKFPPELGNGYWQNIELSQGLLLTIADGYAIEDIVFKMPVREHPVELVVQCASDRIFSSGTKKSVWESKLFGSGIASSNTVEMPKMQRIKVVNVHFEPHLLKHFFAESSPELPSELKRLIKKDDWRTCFQSQKISPETFIILQQILHCHHHGLTRKIYLQGKVFELLASHIATLQTNNRTTNCQSKLKQEDIERIYYAKEILLARWQNPPSLLELAREVGLNDYKLKIGFRQCFQTTVFGTLKAYRMEQARQLLAEGSLTVTGVARTVGYANRSHFAAAFKRQYGVNPSAYSSSHMSEIHLG